MNKMINITNLIFINFLIISFLIGSISTIYFYKQQETNSQSTLADWNKKSNINDYMQCSNLSLIDTANCLQDYVVGFYNFTVRKDVPHSLEDIKANGGDCHDYALLYEDMTKTLGFKAQTVKIITSEKLAHRFAVIFDESHYCILDQIFKPNCYTLQE